MENEPIKSKGQEIYRPEMSNKIKRVSGEGLFMSVSKKSEKIATALYMITDLISEKDPIRYKIREASLSVLSDTRSLAYADTGGLYFQLARIVSRSWEILSFMEVATVAGFISDMNYSILKGAIIDFISDIRNRQKIEGFNTIKDMKLIDGQSANLNLKKDFFYLNQADENSMAEESNTIHQSTEKAEQKPAIPMRRETPSSIVRSRSDMKPRSANPESSSDGTERKNKILALIVDKQDISIKDITQYFKEYSQKTVQRDLLSLVAQGKIKRTGEKRWSRYSMA